MAVNISSFHHISPLKESHITQHHRTNRNKTVLPNDITDTSLKPVLHYSIILTYHNIFGPTLFKRPPTSSTGCLHLILTTNPLMICCSNQPQITPNSNRLDVFATLGYDHMPRPNYPHAPWHASSLDTHPPNPHSNAMTH